MRTRATLVIGTAVLLVASCKASDVLNVPPPTDQFGSGTPGNKEEAEAAYNGAKATLFKALDAPPYLLPSAGVLTDEFTTAGAYGYYPKVDARYTSQEQLPGSEGGDQPLEVLFVARSSLLLTATALRRFEPDTAQSKVGEAFALIGYIELFMAEDYCAGMTLSYVPDGGGIIYGRPLTTDSLLGAAEAHFDSALAHAHGNATVLSLASVGLGRTRLDRGSFAQAAAAVHAVPTGFLYNAELNSDPFGAGAIDLYTDLAYNSNSPCAYLNVADREGTNGLNFVSAHDSRLVFDSTVTPTCDKQQFGLADSLFYYPIKFGTPATGFVPLATGVEARLIEAEAALAANAPGTWASDLNALRAAAPATYLALGGPMDPLTTDSTTGASAAMQVDVMFRERAFWLFGTGTRLGDLRRLVRQYHRDQRTVFPTGPYLQGHDPSLPVPIPNYGTAVSLTLPTPASFTPVTNPYYKGCISAPGTA